MSGCGSPEVDILGVTLIDGVTLGVTLLVGVTLGVGVTLAAGVAVGVTDELALTLGAGIQPFCNRQSSLSLYPLLEALASVTP